MTAALRAGAIAACQRYGLEKFASAIPGLMTLDEQAASERAERLVPMVPSGPLHSRGYGEVFDSPGAVPPIPPPPPGGTYSPEEQRIIMRTALERIGAVARDRADRDNLAAGGHLRIASAPWTSTSVAVAPGNDEHRHGSADLTYAAGFGDDSFAKALSGAGVNAGRANSVAAPPAGPRRSPSGTVHGADIEKLTASAFATIAKRDAAARELLERAGPDPLADQRARQRMYGHNDVPSGPWGPAFSSTPSDTFAAPTSAGLVP